MLRNKIAFIQAKQEQEHCYPKKLKFLQEKEDPSAEATHKSQKELLTDVTQGNEPRTGLTHLHTRDLSFFFLSFKIGSHYVVQAGLSLPVCGVRVEP